MIDKRILEESQSFRKEWSEKLADFPALIPDLSWPSLWTIDHLCRSLRYRQDWNKKEKYFIRGVAAYFGEFIYKCWETFASDIRLQYGRHGIECVAVRRKNILSKEVNKLEIQKSIINILQKPANPFPVGGKQWVLASDNTNFLGEFAYGACFGMSAYGIGNWSKKMPGELKEHIERVEPFLASTITQYYKRLFDNSEACLNYNFYLSDLIWPPAGYHGDYCNKVGAEGIYDYQVKTKQILSIEELINLSKMPDPTISGGALVYLLTKLKKSDLRKELTEICFNEVSSGRYRHVINDLAKKEGKTIDWQKTLDHDRFELEKRLMLLPITYLDFNMCISREYNELVEKLVNTDIADALKCIEKYENTNPWILFQKGMLFKVQTKYEEAHRYFIEINNKHPDFRNSEFLNEFGMNYLNRNDIQKAILLLNEAAKYDKVWGRSLINLAWAYICHNDFKKAIEISDIAVDKVDYIVTALLNRAFAFKKLGEFDKAKHDIMMAANLYPFDKRCVTNIMEDQFN